LQCKEFRITRENMGQELRGAARAAPVAGRAAHEKVRISGRFPRLSRCSGIGTTTALAVPVVERDASMNADLKETLGRRIIEATHRAVAMHLYEATQLRRRVAIGGAGRMVGGTDLSRDRMSDSNRASDRNRVGDLLDGGGCLRHGED
jgi:hypothetical protein